MHRERGRKDVLLGDEAYPRLRGRMEGDRACGAPRLVFPSKDFNERSFPSTWDPCFLRSCAGRSFR